MKHNSQPASLASHSLSQTRAVVKYNSSRTNKSFHFLFLQSLNPVWIVEARPDGKLPAKIIRMFYLPPKMSTVCSPFQLGISNIGILYDQYFLRCMRQVYAKRDIYNMMVLNLCTLFEQPAERCWRMRSKAEKKILAHCRMRMIKSKIIIFFIDDITDFIHSHTHIFQSRWDDLRCVMSGESRADDFYWFRFPYSPHSLSLDGIINKNPSELKRLIIHVFSFAITRDISFASDSHLSGFFWLITFKS